MSTGGKNSLVQRLSSRSTVFQPDCFFNQECPSANWEEQVVEMKEPVVYLDSLMPYTSDTHDTLAFGTVGFS